MCLRSTEALRTPNLELTHDPRMCQEFVDR